MNEEKVRKLIDHLKTIDANTFAMEHWLIPVSELQSEEPHLHVINSIGTLVDERREKPQDDWCGTAGCLAGHTCMLFYEEVREFTKGYGHVPVVAASILELETHVANYLFTPRNVDDLRELTLPQAIVVLEHFLATGEVDWTLDAGD